MEAMLFVYLANILPQFAVIFDEGLFFLLCFLFGFSVVGLVAMSEEALNLLTYKKVLKITLSLLCVFALLKALTPDRDTVYLMAGAYVGQQLLTSEIAKDTYEIIGLEVKSILKEKKKEAEEAVQKTVKEVTKEVTP